MYSPEMVQKVKQLLEAGLTYREIAGLTGVSRGTVATIRRGKPRAYGQTREVSDWAERCPTCGNRVFQPCRICEVRRHQSQVLAQRRGEPCGPPTGPSSSRPAA